MHRAIRHLVPACVFLAALAPPCGLSTTVAQELAVGSIRADRKFPTGMCPLPERNAENTWSFVPPGTEATFTFERRGPATFQSGGNTVFVNNVLAYVGVVRRSAYDTPSYRTSSQCYINPNPLGPTCSSNPAYCTFDLLEQNVPAALVAYSNGFESTPLLTCPTGWSCDSGVRVNTISGFNQRGLFFGAQGVTCGDCTATFHVQNLTPNEEYIVYAEWYVNDMPSPGYTTLQLDISYPGSCTAMDELGQETSLGIVPSGERAFELESSLYGYGLVWSQSTPLPGGGTHHEVRFRALRPNGTPHGADLVLDTMDIPAGMFGEFRSARLAWDGSKFGVVWVRISNDLYPFPDEDGAYFRALDGKGVPLDSEWMVDRRPSPGAQWSPPSSVDVTANGLHSSLTWVFVYESGGTIAGKHLSGLGNETSSFTVGSGTNPKVACSNAVLCGIVYEYLQDVWFAFFSRDCCNAFLHQPISLAGRVDRYPKIAWNPQLAEFGVIWEALDNNVYLARMGADYGPLIPEVAVSPGGRKIRPDIEWNGAEYAVAWRQDASPSPRIELARLLPSGQVVGAVEALADVDGCSLHPDVEVDGERYATVWENGCATSLFIAHAGCRCPDADGDTASTCENDCDDHNAARFPGNPELCDGIDNDCDGAPDEGSPPAAGRPSLILTKVAGSSVVVNWTPVPYSASFDIASGNLGMLRSTAGDFAASTTSCVGNNVVGTSVADPAVLALGAGIWYLARGVSTCGGSGTYDEGATGQIGIRDGEIAASPTPCP